MTFTGPFFSIKGQVERLKNVGAVLSQSLNPFSNIKPVANVQNKTIKAGLEFVAANPYTTAAIATLPASAPARAAVGGAIGSLSTGIKVLGGAVVTIGTGAVISSPQAAKTVTKIAGSVTPESLLRLGSNVGKGVENVSKIPENATISEKLKKTGEEVKNVLAENKVTLETLGAGTLLAGGIAVIPSVINAFQSSRILNETQEQTEAIKRQAAAAEAALKNPTAATPSGTSTVPSKQETLSSPMVTTPKTPITPETQIVKVGGTSGSKKRKKAVSKPLIQSIRQNVAVVVQNKNNVVGNKRYIKREVMLV